MENGTSNRHSGKSINIKLLSKKVITIAVIALATLVFLIVLLATRGKTVPKYDIQIDKEKNGQIITNCDAIEGNLATSYCKAVTITGKTLLDEDSILLYKHDYSPSAGNQLDVSDYELKNMSSQDKKVALNDAAISLNKYVKANGTFAITTDTNSISNTDKTDKEIIDVSLMLYNVKSHNTVAIKDLKILYILTDKDKAFRSSQLIKLNAYEDSKPADIPSTTGTSSSPTATAVPKSATVAPKTSNSSTPPPNSTTNDNLILEAEATCKEYAQSYFGVQDINMSYDQSSIRRINPDGSILIKAKIADSQGAFHRQKPLGTMECTTEKTGMRVINFITY
jgi:hypothetical protein